MTTVLIISVRYVLTILRYVLEKQHNDQVNLFLFPVCCFEVFACHISHYSQTHQLCFELFVYDRSSVRRRGLGQIHYRVKSITQSLEEENYPACAHQVGFSAQFHADRSTCIGTTKLIDREGM